MIRKFSLLSLLAPLVVTLGCSNGETTDPNDLKPLTPEQQAEIAKADAAIDEAEGEVYVAPKGSAKKK